MTDKENSRRIGGLEPRAAAPDLSRLIRRNRPEADATAKNATTAGDNESDGDVRKSRLRVLTKLPRPTK
jgi:recombination DNA repair RAD52 pathway protein